MKIDTTKFDAIECNGHTFYTAEEFTLPLYIKGKEGFIEIEIDEYLEYYDTAREMLEEKGFILSECGYYLFTVDCLDIIGSIDYYYGGTDIVDSTTSFYKLGEKLFVESPANDDNYYVGDYAEPMFGDELCPAEIFIQGNDELKEFYFGAELKDIETIVCEVNSNICYRIVNSVDLQGMGSPTHTFMHLGITEDKELIVYDINNCNVTRADRSKAEIFTIEELQERNKKVSYTLWEEEEDLRYVPDDEDMQTIFDFWTENKD